MYTATEIAVQMLVCEIIDTLYLNIYSYAFYDVVVVLFHVMFRTLVQICIARKYLWGERSVE